MHKPVLLNEVIEFAKGAEPRTVLDGTFGRGGHTRALLEALPGITLTALDQDNSAVEYAKSAFAAPIAEKRLSVKHFNFHEIKDLKHDPFDVILLDLGVSSPQL